jgi:8-oxo-dGTP pyrophosphatase MutT (NUDIX family)
MPKKDFYQVSLKVILKNNKNEILALNGHPRGSFAGFYDLPGGRINEDEFTTSFIDIIQREAKEEIGDIKMIINSKPVAIGRHLIPASMTSEKEDLHVLYVFFEATLIEGEIKISSEHDGFKWIDIKKSQPAKLFKSGILDGINMYLGVDDGI